MVLLPYLFCTGLNSLCTMFFIHICWSNLWPLLKVKWQVEIYILQFRALSDQFYRSPEHHKFVRQQVINQVHFLLDMARILHRLATIRFQDLNPQVLLLFQLKSHPEFYEGYVPMEYGDYLKKLSKYSSFLVTHLVLALLCCMNITRVW